MVIGGRLEEIVDLIDPCDLLIDIGTDHALVCIRAIEKGLVKQAIGIDNKKTPLKYAQRNINREKMQEKISLILNDGMKGVKIQADCWTIAGLGGETIIEILNAARMKSRKVKQIILQPQSKVHLVRKYLYENGFEIVKDNLNFTGRFYHIIKARYIGVPYEYREAELYISQKLTEHYYFPVWLKYEFERYHDLMKMNPVKYFDLFIVFKEEYRRILLEDNALD